MSWDKKRRNAHDRWRYAHNHLRFRDRTLRRMRKRYRDDAAFRARCKERSRKNYRKARGLNVRANRRIAAKENAPAGSKAGARSIGVIG
jgi:hypothetical protein